MAERTPLWLAAAIWIGTATAALAEPLPRVMSLNVCTDQLVLMLAEPEQIVSVSDLATDPNLSFFHEKAEGLPQNGGRAEEVFLARPDRIVTGVYSLHNTTALLRRLGFEVEEFDFNQTLDTIPREVRRMGSILGQKARAETVAGDYESQRDALDRSLCGEDPTLVAYEQNGIALGAGTLADAAIRAAGFRNLAAERGFQGMAPFPLETLVASRPDVVVLPDILAGTPSLADQISDHPAIDAIPGTLAGRFVPRGSWSCGGPFVLEAVKALRRLRDKLVQCPRAEPSQ